MREGRRKGEKKGGRKKNGKQTHKLAKYKVGASSLKEDCLCSADKKADQLPDEHTEFHQNTDKRISPHTDTQQSQQWFLRTLVKGP